MVRKRRLPTLPFEMANCRVGMWTAMSSCHLFFPLSEPWLWYPDRSFLNFRSLKSNVYIGPKRQSTVDPLKLRYIRSSVDGPVKIILEKNTRIWMELTSNDGMGKKTHWFKSYQCNIGSVTSNWFPTSPLTILKTKNQEIGEFHVVRNVVRGILKLQSCERVRRVSLLAVPALYQPVLACLRPKMTHSNSITISESISIYLFFFSIST